MKAVSQPLSAPSPIGGLNARDALAAMPPNDAVILDNFFPNPTSVDLRNGYVVWATGLPADVESLMTYNSATASTQYAASGTSFYDVTASGAVGAAVVTGLANARWQSANMGTTGGQFLVCVNGSDSMQLYNGTAWQQVTAVSAPIAITGITTANLIDVNVYKNRLFFVEKNSCNIWYLPVNSVGGAAAKIDMSPLFKFGGYLVSMATWTIDNAAGVNEFAVFISSEGEVVIYNGTDPSVADNWAIYGQFKIGRPVGRRCHVKVGSDVILISADGFFPLSKALLTDRSQLQDAISNKIINLVNNDVKNYADHFGWQACFYPIGNKLIINVPETEGKKQRQYVMNTITGAWCRFKGWNANCFNLVGDSMYFGGNLGSSANSGYVAKADTGYSDNGAYITGEAKTAFRYFGATGLKKRVTLVRPIFFTAGSMKAGIGIDYDFQDKLPTSQPSFSGISGTAWNTGAWNTFPWGDSSGIKKDWQGATGSGNCAALHMKILNNKFPVQWQSIDYVYEIGGVL